MSVRGGVGFWLMLAALLAAVAWWLLGSRPAVETPASRNEFATVLAAWRRAAAERPAPNLPARPIAFPRDHGAHAEVPAEHWDLLIRAGAGEHPFLLHVSLARLGAAAEAADRPSRWGASQFFRAAVSMTDLRSGRDRRHQRYARSALGLSGFASDPPRVWIGDNRLEWPGEAGAPNGLRVTLREPRLTADLRITPVKTVRTADSSSQWSERWHGYVIPRAAVAGEWAETGEALPVQGIAWLSHGWGELPPVGGQIAFDRWTLLLDDETELALLHLRRRDGTGEGTFQGIRIAPDGTLERLDADAVRLRPLAFEDGFATRWRLQVPDKALDLKLIAAPRDRQRMDQPAALERALAIERTGAEGRPAGWGFLEPDGF